MDDNVTLCSKDLVLKFFLKLLIFFLLGKMVFPSTSTKTTGQYDLTSGQMYGMTWADRAVILVLQ